VVYSGKDICIRHQAHCKRAGSKFHWQRDSGDGWWSRPR